jgi:hypothetical protein
MSVSALRQEYLDRIAGRSAPFHGVYVQLAHKDGEPTSPEPAFRILRAVHDPANKDKIDAVLRKRMAGYGNVFYFEYGKPILIATSFAKLVDPAYYEKRVAEIETEALNAVTERDNRFNLLKGLKHDGKSDEVEEIVTAKDAKHNTKGWVKYMKKAAAIPENNVVPEGARCEMPLADDVADFEADGDGDIDAHSLPKKVVATDGSQTTAVCTVMLSSDEDMEAVVYIHDFVAKNGNIGDACSRVGMITTPMPPDAFDVGEWVYPVANAWTNEPEEESWADRDVHKMQTKRKKDAKAAHAKQVELIEQDRKRIEAVKTLAARVGLSVEDTTAICQTMEGTQDLIACTAINDPANREEAIAKCKRDYMDPAGPSEAAPAATPATAALAGPGPPLKK